MLGNVPEVPLPMLRTVPLSVTDCPTVAKEGLIALSAVRSAAAAGETESELLQATVTFWAPEVMATDPVWVPAVLYVFVNGLLVPARPSVPLQEYAYTPVPPAAVAVQVAVPPTDTEVGDTEHEPDSGGGTTVTVAVACVEPALFVQVSV